MIILYNVGENKKALLPWQTKELSFMAEKEGFEAPQAALRARMSPLALGAARRNRSGMTRVRIPPVTKTTHPTGCVVFLAEKEGFELSKKHPNSV